MFLAVAFFQSNIGFAEPSEMTEVVLQHNKGNDDNIKKYRTIVDSSSEEQNIAKYQKLSDVFASPVPNQLVLLRGKLVQSLNGKDLFVFQDDNIISNMIITPSLWAQINEKSYVLDKNIQFLAKVSINHDNQSIELQAIKIFSGISNTESYVLTGEDKELSRSLSDKVAMVSANNFKIVAAETLTTEGNTAQEDNNSVDENNNAPENNAQGNNAVENNNSVDEEAAKPAENPYIDSFRNKELPAAPSNAKETSHAITKEDTHPTIANDKLDTNSSVKEETIDENASIEESESAKEPVVEAAPRPYPSEDVKNQVPAETTLKTRAAYHEDYNVLEPEEIKKAETSDNKPKQTEQKKSSWFGK
jgi:hypothetical protein